MSFHAWLLFAFAYLLTTLTPGPNVMLVIRNTVRHGARGTIATVAGNLSVQLGVTVMVALGVGTILVEMPPLFVALKGLGAGYLIYLGVRQWRGAGRPAHATQASGSPHVGAGPAGGAGAAVVAAPVSHLRLLREAMIVSGSNPKTIIFFSAFMPQFVDHQRALPLQFVEMYLTVAVTVTMVHAVYSAGVRHLHGRLRASRAMAALRRTTGLVFVGFGVELLTAKQP